MTYLGIDPCPRCGAAVTGFSFALPSQRRMNADGRAVPARTYAEPCGHEVFVVLHGDLTRLFRV